MPLRGNTRIGTSRCDTRTASSAGGTQWDTERASAPRLSGPPCRIKPTGARRPARWKTLPYRVELWRADAANEIGRAASAQLARAIFTAAQAEHPQRRI